MKALVTGATGFVGYWVARKLQERGHSVKILVRQLPPHLENTTFEIAYGDLRDKDSLRKALQDCNQLYHVAAHYRLWDKNPKVFYDINVEGTRNLMTLASETNLEKIIYTSSVATIKIMPDKVPSTEANEAGIEDMIGDYKKSKFLAEMVVREMAQDGLPVVIVNPSAPVGSYDVKPTPTGKIIVDFLQGKMPAYLDTGLNLVDVEDVAIGHILAAEKGEIGKRYILGNQNLRLIDILQILAKISGKKAPKIRMPYWIAYAAGKASEIFAQCTGQEPAIPLDGVRMAKKFMFFDSSLAKKEIGYEPQSIEAALEKAIAWFKDKHYV